MESTPSPNPKTITIIAGNYSFIARSLVAALLNSSFSTSSLTIRIADPKPSTETEPQSGRIRYIPTRFNDLSQLRSAIEGSSAVFHVDPTIGTASPPPTDFYGNYKALIEGTKNVVRVCRDCGVERLIYTGSADVVFDGVRDVVDGDESLPYPDKFVDVLNDLRVQAELLVLNANGNSGLSTCVLLTGKPFGQGDDYFVPFLVGKAKSARAKFIIGSGKNLCVLTYVENVAPAKICAEKVLSSEAASVDGKA